MQLRELREYVSRRGWECVGEYVDTGWSGAKASRPQLDRLMADARMRRFDAVVVWKLDRWGRSVANCLASIQELTKLGVRWIAITQNLDTDESNPMSRFMLTIMAAVAEFEREMIRERVRAGMKAAKHRGKKCGRPKAVFDRQAAVELRASGLSVREIAQRLGVGKGTVEATARGEWRQRQESRKEVAAGCPKMVAATTVVNRRIDDPNWTIFHCPKS
jgi:DNA invertase Pin-like site-specific DNA recombinase